MLAGNFASMIVDVPHFSWQVDFLYWENSGFVVELRVKIVIQVIVTQVIVG